MGVPALFRWLSRKYPKTISQVVEDDPIEVDGVQLPCDYSKPNPNGELDNLYLDMNGIVHPCTHPEGKPPPETEDEMMLEIFKYTDRVISMARPRKVLMMAVDGVAPRAKMNQQRSRRFKAAKDAREAAVAKEDEIAKAEARGEMIDDAIKEKKRWDTNVITPGTPFMDILAKSLRYWVSYKLKYDPGWKDLKVIISDATVPGEGEHKIMEFIRSQRSDPSHDPNTSHCIYGLDADLIFLGLATHEPHFKILREDVFAKENKKRSRPPALTAGEIEREKQESEIDKQSKKPFLWLHVDILREYLELELAVPQCPFPFDLERAIDDWVFMCFFCGNDFLPHMPSLDVRDNSIDMLAGIWKRKLAAMGGYLTCDGTVNLKRVEIMMTALGQQEDNIFRKKRDQEVRRTQNAKQRKLDRVQTETAPNGAPPPPAISKNRTGDRAPIRPLDNMPLYTPKGESVGSVHMSNSELVANRSKITLANMANKSAAQLLKAQMAGKTDVQDEAPSQADPSGDDDKQDKSNSNDTPIDPVDPQAKSNENAQGASEAPLVVDNDNGLQHPEDPHAGQKRKASEDLVKQIEEEFQEPHDNVRLWEPGYRDRYYHHKFHVAENDYEFRKQVVKKYIEGVCWVLLYYYQGCASWNWYYPYHYAPFAQDMTELESLDITFEKGEPFLPFEQLMSVLPADSDHALPEVFRPLMSEPDSEIIDFYPVDFPIDMNGKKLAWLGIPLLPFIDETRLLEAVRGKYPQLTAQETERNSRKEEIVLISRNNKLYNELVNVYDSNSPKVTLSAHRGNGLAGMITAEDGYTPNKPLEVPVEGDMPSIPDNDTLTVKYQYPPKVHTHKSMLLTGVKYRDPPILNDQDRDAILNMGQGYAQRRGGPGGRRNDNFDDAGQNYYGDRNSYGFRYRQGGYTKFATMQSEYGNGHSDGQRYSGYSHGNRGGYGGRGGYNGGRGGGYNNGYNGGRGGGYNHGQGGYNSGYGGQGGYNSGYGGQGGYNAYNAYSGGYRGRGGYNQGRGGRGGYNQGYNQGGYGRYQSNNNAPVNIPPPTRSSYQYNPQNGGSYGDDSRSRYGSSGGGNYRR